MRNLLSLINLSLLYLTVAAGSLKGQASLQNESSENGLEDVPHTQLNNQKKFPLVGMGVGNLQHELIVEEIMHGMADNMRYRLVDTAHASQNEHLVQQGVLDGLQASASANANLSNGAKAVHVVTKVWYTYLGYERTKIAVNEIVQALNDSSLRIHILLHWPRCRDDIPWMDCENEEARLPKTVRDAGPPPHLDKDHAFLESWRALEDIYTGKTSVSRGGQIASIGVSNFEQKDMEELQKIWRIPPAIYQGNVWSMLFDPHLMSFLKENKIHFQAYNVMNGIFSRAKEAPNAFDSLRLIRDAMVIQKEEQEHGLGEGSNFTPYMVALKWITQQDVSIIPRTTNLDHLEFNSAVSLQAFPHLEERQMKKVERAVDALLRGHDLEVPRASFHNQSEDGHVHLFWSSHDGKEVPVAKVKPGESFHTNTYTGHKFIAYDETRKSRREFTIRAGFSEHEEFRVDEL